MQKSTIRLRVKNQMIIHFIERSLSLMQINASCKWFADLGLTPARCHR